MLENITVRKYLGNRIDNDTNIKQLMTNMSITTLPVNKLFEITGVMSPEELYDYIMCEDNYVFLAELGFDNNKNYSYPKVKSIREKYQLNDEQSIIVASVGNVIYQENLPSKMFYKKKVRK